jgi:hypothetical protein
MLPALQLVGVAVVPLNVTVVAPWLAPKPDPAIVTEVPAAPVAGDTLVRIGLGLSVKDCGLVAWPPTVTTTFPLVDPVGGKVTIWFSDHEVGVAGVPLNVTVLVPWESPKEPPLIWTEVPTVPEVGDKLVMPGLTVKTIPLLSRVLKFASWYSTLTGLATAHEGTATTKVVSFELVGKARHPLPKKSRKTTTGRVPAALKPTPVMVMEFPMIPDVGDKFVISGMVVNFTALLARFDTATPTDPVKLPPGRVTPMLVSLQLVGVTVMPLNDTVLVPWVPPKLVPVIVTSVPGVAAFGEIDEITGPTITVKKAAEPVIPEAVTVTFPFVAPEGTGTTICVGLQLVGVAAAPSKVTVLVPWVKPKFVPVMVTDAPTRPDVGDKLEIFGLPGVVKLTPLLAVPETVTVTGPLVAPAGTDAMILVALQLVGVAAVPLNETELVPCVDPKFDPVIVIAVPGEPDVGDTPAIVGVVVTVKLTGLLGTPATVTMTLPVAALVGTIAAIFVEDQLVTLAAAPFKVTALLPWVAPKLVPEIWNAAPTPPLEGDKFAMTGVGRTVKAARLLLSPLAWTTMSPVVAPDGTGTVIWAALQVVGVATKPLNETVLDPWVVPKPEPEIVTLLPAAAEAGDTLAMSGGKTTVKLTPLLSTPLAWTTTFPVVAPEGTVAAMLPALQLVTVAGIPLNLTVLLPWVDPKFDPAIVTDAPTAPEPGVRLVIAGAATTVKLFPLLSTPLACTMTFPVVPPEGTVTTMLPELQVVTVAVVPLNLTVLLPWDEPKFAPAIVTEAPTAPVVGERLVMLGAASTVKLFPLLATPDTVTTTLPVVAPLGTETVMLVALQHVPQGVAVVPLNFTVLDPWLAPKFVPVIVIDAPTAPVVGDRLVMVGAAWAWLVANRGRNENTKTTSLQLVKRIYIPSPDWSATLRKRAHFKIER